MIAASQVKMRTTAIYLKTLTICYLPLGSDFGISTQALSMMRTEKDLPSDPTETSLMILVLFAIKANIITRMPISPLMVNVFRRKCISYLLDPRITNAKPLEESYMNRNLLSTVNIRSNPRAQLHSPILFNVDFPSAVRETTVEAVAAEKSTVVQEKVTASESLDAAQKDALVGEFVPSPDIEC